MEISQTSRPYCGVGCRVIATVAGDGAVSVRGGPDHPANYGRLCSKGSALAETIDLDERTLHPEIGGRRVAWDVALDPRRTIAPDIADLHLAIRPDAGVALFVGLVSHLVSHGAVDRAYIAAHIRGFAAASAAADTVSFADVVTRTGLADRQLREFYRLFTATEKVVTFYSQGVNQSSSGTDKVNAILNCHLVTGRIGRPGIGPFSLAGQPNAMGGREVGGLANMLAAHRDRLRHFWRSPAMTQKLGLAVDLFQTVGKGASGRYGAWRRTRSFPCRMPTWLRRR